MIFFFKPFSNLGLLIPLVLLCLCIGWIGCEEDTSTVKIQSISITLPDSDITVPENDAEIQFQANVVPQGATVKTINWYIDETVEFTQNSPTNFVYLHSFTSGEHQVMVEAIGETKTVQSEILNVTVTSND